MLTTTAPSRSTANAAMMYCGQFGSMIPTRSPLTMPSSASAAASASDRALQIEIRQLRAEKLRRDLVRPMRPR